VPIVGHDGPQVPGGSRPEWSAGGRDCCRRRSTSLAFIWLRPQAAVGDGDLRSGFVTAQPVRGSRVVSSGRAPTSERAVVASGYGRIRRWGPAHEAGPSDRSSFALTIGGRPPSKTYGRSMRNASSPERGRFLWCGLRALRGSAGLGAGEGPVVVEAFGGGSGPWAPLAWRASLPGVDEDQGV
jgi:hypothetical protein